MTNQEKAISAFSTQVMTITGRTVRESELKRFNDMSEVAYVHKDYLIQYSFCDFQTVSGKAETISINLLTVSKPLR